MIPTVLGVIACSIDSILIKLSLPISTGTGIPPVILIAEAVANIVCDEIIISSPFFKPIASRKISIPSVALPTPTA